MKCDRSYFPRKQTLRFEELEARIVLASSVGWDGPGLGAASLTYYIGQAPGGLTQEQFKSAIETALAAWSKVVNVDFTQTMQAGLRNSIDFTSTNIDGSGGALAQAYYPSDVNPARIAGDVQFDISESWEIGNARGNSAFDLIAVAVHEIGHALGLDHTSESDSIMAPSISANESFTALDASDVTAIQQLYSPRVSTTPTDSTDDDVPAGTNSDDMPVVNKPAPPREAYPYRTFWHHSYSFWRFHFGRWASTAFETALSNPSRDISSATNTDAVDDTDDKCLSNSAEELETLRSNAVDRALEDAKPYDSSENYTKLGASKFVDFAYAKAARSVTNTDETGGSELKADNVGAYNGSQRLTGPSALRTRLGRWR